jgi:hypothetical protein
MKQLGKIELTDEQWSEIKKAYIDFYEAENKCNNLCPLDHLSYDMREEILSDKMDASCNLCYQFEELQNGIEDVCPCHKFGEKAFVRLEKLIGRLIKGENDEND